MSVIQCQDLTKAYGKLKAIDHLTFEIEENRITGLMVEMVPEKQRC